jgi:hypothetical protein
MPATDVLDKDQLNDIYQDILARIDMRLAHDDSGELDAGKFNEQVSDAILERMPHINRENLVLDLYSTAFGVMCERILREYYDEYGKDWW